MSVRDRDSRGADGGASPESVDGYVATWLMSTPRSGSLC